MSGVVTRVADPVEEYVAALAARLRGPERARTLLIQEIRDGLLDATAAHTDAGETHDRAARRAVREFGTVDDLVPGCQRELTIAQTRRTARVLALAAALLLGYARLVWVTAGDQAPAWRLLGAGLAVGAVGAGLAAASALAATGALARRLPTPRRVPEAIAWTGTAASAALAITTVGLVATSAFTTNWPLTVAGGVLAAASHAMLAGSARACRRCTTQPE